MRLQSIFFVLGIVIMFVGFAMLLPLTFAFFYGEASEINVFLISMAITVVTGFIFYKIMKFDEKLTNKEGILIGALGWLIIPIFGCLPYVFSNTLPFIDAYFEAVSGFTTTGATVISDIEIADKSILLWRSFTQWLGGMGILLLFVALIPKMGIGGSRLLMAETPGPTVSKIVPRVSEYAKSVWIVYILFSIVGIVLLMLVGLNFYDALNHAFTGISTGGFSTKNAGVGAFNNSLVDYIVILLMFLGGGNFALYYYAFYLKRKPLMLFKDEEYRTYLFILLGAFLISFSVLYVGFYGNISDAFRYGLFQTISLKTGSGHVTYDYDQWTNVVKMTLFLLMFFGGCQYSTTGGIKTVRMLIALKFIKGELVKSIHPRVIYQIKINKTPVADNVVNNVIGFFLMYFIAFALSSLFLSAYSFDKVSSLTAAAAILGNVGPAMGIFGPTATYAELPNVLKIWLSFTMILGRLEVYPLIALLQVIISSKK